MSTQLCNISTILFLLLFFPVRSHKDSSFQTELKIKCSLISVASLQPNSLLLQPRGTVVRAKQWRALLWLSGRWRSCYHGGLLCQRRRAPSRHGRHHHGRGQQPHHLQRQHLPDPRWKYGGKPQPHIALVAFLLGYGEQQPSRCAVILVHIYQLEQDQ